MSSTGEHVRKVGSAVGLSEGLAVGTFVGFPVEGEVVEATDGLEVVGIEVGGS